MAEEYQRADILYDGERLSDVAVRTKGNSSLNFVANNPGSVRFPFKLDTNRFVDGQKLRGLKKLNFNNGFKDPSLQHKIINRSSDKWCANYARCEQKNLRVLREVRDLVPLLLQLRDRCKNSALFS